MTDGALQHRAELEERFGKEIYDRAFERCGGVKPEWVPGGNSLKQVEARRLAGKIIVEVAEALCPRLQVDAKSSHLLRRFLEVS